MGGKRLTDQEKTKRLANGRPGAYRVAEVDGGVFVDRWRPRLGGRFVRDGDGPSTYLTPAAAKAAAARVRDFARALLARLPTPERAAPGSSEGGK